MKTHYDLREKILKIYPHARIESPDQGRSMLYGLFRCKIGDHVFEESHTYLLKQGNLEEFLGRIKKQAGYQLVEISEFYTPGIARSLLLLVLNNLDNPIYKDMLDIATRERGVFYYDEGKSGGSPRRLLFSKKSSEEGNRTLP